MKKLSNTVDILWKENESSFNSQTYLLNLEIEK